MRLLHTVAAIALTATLPGCGGLSDAERVWCEGHRTELARAYEVTGGEVPQGEAEEVRFQSAVDAYLEGLPEPTGVMGMFELSAAETAAVDRACKAAYEGR